MREEAALLTLSLLLVVDLPAQGSLQEKLLGGRQEYLTSRGDKTWYLIDGSFYLRIGDLEVKADRATLSFDRDEYDRFTSSLAKGGALPRRAPIAPHDLSAQANAKKRKRLEEIGPAALLKGGLLKGGDVGKLDQESRNRLALLVRGVHAVGNVSFSKGGIKHLRCDEIWISLPSDRAVMKNVHLRFPLGSTIAATTSMTLSCPLLVQQGNRLFAYNASLSTCDAGEPHYRLDSDRLVLIRRKDVTEFIGQGNILRIDGLPPIPLPNYTFYSDQESLLPLKGARGGVSEELGEFAYAEFGGRWNRIGQSIVDFFGNREARFRGTWRLETGHSRKRGVPFDALLTYGLPGSFEGSLEFYRLDDDGKNIRSPIQTLGGSIIDDEGRQFLRSRTRVHVGENWRLDIESFKASDQSVYPEFRATALKGEEIPETSVHLLKTWRNMRLSVLARTNLNSFQYDDTIKLTDRFREERPRLGFDLIQEPLFHLSENWPVVMDVGIDQGFFENHFDGTLASRPSQTAYRSDLTLEIRAPFIVGPYAVTPFFRAKDSWYSDSPSGRSLNRKAFEAGALAGTRFVRDFDVQSETFELDGLRHDIRPQIRVGHIYEVDRGPLEFHQFDELDQLDKGAFIDFNILNLLQTRSGSAVGKGIRDLLWLDLTQRIHPIAGRDNNGKHLGLFEFEAIAQGGAGWLPLPNLRLVFEGERDWNKNEFRTRNIGMNFGMSKWQINGRLRDGKDGDGTTSWGMNVKFWRRWNVSFGVQWDLEKKEVLTKGLSLIREDHDWRWLISVSQNEITGDRAFRIQFEPRLLDLLKPRRQGFVGGDIGFGTRSNIAY